MKIEFSKYTLEQKKAGGKREGILLKAYFENDSIGYGDCHPWPELGDRPIQEQLSFLKRRHATSLMRCSLKMAYLDGEARKQNKSLLGPLSIPLSHFLISNVLICTKQELENLSHQGFTHLKIKLGRQLPQEMAQLLDLFSNSSFRLRLDFNERLTIEEFHLFMSSIKSIKHLIDFIEDPIVFDSEIWKSLQSKYQVALACDRQAIAALHFPDSAKILVVKPAICPMELFDQVPRERMIVTSYLDHPIGQVAAAYVAASIDPKGSRVHGLLSHHVYEQNAFSQSLNQKGPHFSSPQGTGFGYDEELSKLDWREI